MSDHFSLDVNPEALRNAARTLRELAASTEAKGTAVARTPGEIGDTWTGDAATKIKGEMTGLGGHMKGFSPKFTATKAAISSLADDYEEAEREVGKLNERYAQADVDYDAAVAKADTQHDQTVQSARPDKGHVNRAVLDEIAGIRGNAVSAASAARQETRHNLEYSFGMTKQWLAQQTRACATKLADATPLPVPPDAISAYQSSGQFPVRLDRSLLEQGMELTAELNTAEVQREQIAEGQELAEELRDADGAVSAELAEQIRQHMHNPYFANGFASELSPEEVASILGEYHNEDGVSPSSPVPGEDPDGVWEDLVVGIGTTLATATRGEGDLALPEDYAAQYAEAITADVSEDVPPNQAQYLGLLMEYGQWDTDFLDTAGDTLYDYEKSKDGDPVWGPKADPMYPVRGPDGQVRTDVMASLMKAMEHNPQAAQEFFADGGTTTIEVNGEDLEVSERMQYLVVDRTWDTMTDPTNGGNLGGALEAATTYYRNQEESGRTSAELASQLFVVIGNQSGEGSSWKDDGWQMWDGMRDNVADITASYANDLMRMGRERDADSLGEPWYVGPEEEYFGEDVPYGAEMDPAMMQAVLGALAEDDELINRVVAAVGVSSQARTNLALHEALGDMSEPPAPVAMLQGLSLPQVTTATNESAATIGWVLNGAYRGVLEDEELAEKQAAMRQQLFDSLTALPGVGPAGKWSQFAFEQGTDLISDQLGDVETTGGATYGGLSTQEKESLRRTILNQMLTEGYFDEEYIVEANGSPDGTRYAAPPSGAIIDGDPPRFDYESQDYQDWLRTKFPMDEFLNSNVYVPFNESLNEGLALAGDS